MNKAQQISDNPVYQQVIKESFGGVLYDVDNRDKYDSSEIIELWDSMTAQEKEAVGGIMIGAFHFLKGE